MKNFLKKLAIGVGSGIVIAALMTLFMDNLLTDLWNNLENKTYDFRYRNKYRGQNYGETLQEGVRAVKFNEDVVIVNIDERSMLADNMGVYYKWPRRYHGELIEYLKQGNAASVTFDVHFNDADYGKKETQRIMGVFEAQKDRSNLAAGDLLRLKSIISEGVNYDRDLVEATRRSGITVHAMILNDTNNYANKSDYLERTTEAYRIACNPELSTARFSETVMNAIRNYPVLDGAFPELAQAADRIALVNVSADEDGIHRTIPLLNRFRGWAYPGIAFQTCLRLMGRTLKEVDVVPGSHIGLGKPVYVKKETDGSLRVSYPGVNESMVRALVAKAAEIRLLKEGASLPVAEKMTVTKDTAGAVTLDITAGTLSFSSIRDLNGIPADQFKAMPLNEPVGISDATGLLRTGESEYSIVEIQNNEKSIEYIPLATLTAVSSLDGKRIMALKPGESWTVSQAMTVTRKPEGLETEYILLRHKALDEILALKEADLDKLKPGETLFFGDSMRIPVDANCRMRINYQGLNQRTFKTISYYDIWAKRVPAEYFCGKIFLVGSDAPSMFDIVSAPVYENYPGVEIHATVMADILKNDFMTDPDRKSMFLIVLLLTVLIAAVSLFIRPVFSVPLLLLSSLAYFVVAMSYFDKNINLEIVRPVFGMIGAFVFALIYRYITEEKDKKFLKATFSNYLSAELIDQMYENKQFPQLGGDESVCTAYFTDIQGFSTFSEKLGSPTRLVELLNEYLSGMTDILMENGGTLDKYIGDAIVAMFGAPLKLADHADKACLTAIGMQNKLAELRAKWRAEGDKWPEIVHIMRMRIGINTGNIVTGNMGSKKRMNYTMMGDPVNLAARLESAAKQYGVFTMFSNYTRDIIGDRYDIRELDKITVVGKSEPVTIYELLETKGKSPQNVIEIVGEFNEGLQQYKKQEWDKAIEIFTHSSKLEKEWRPDQKTNPSKLYISRCEQFKAAPPGADWDGVYKLTSK